MNQQNIRLVLKDLQRKLRSKDSKKTMEFIALALYPEFGNPKEAYAKKLYEIPRQFYVHELLRLVDIFVDVIEPYEAVLLILWNSEDELSSLKRLRRLPLFNNIDFQALVDMCERNVNEMWTSELKATLASESQKYVFQEVTVNSNDNVQQVLSLICTYDKFVGRDENRETVLQIIQDKHGARSIGLYGPGGIGKTALAHWITEYSLDHNLFEQAIWITAKDEFLDEINGIVQLSQVNISLDYILDKLLTLLDKKELTRLELEKKELSLGYILQKKSLLVVLDNLDSLEEGQREEIVSRLDKVLGRSRLIITSRYRLATKSVYPIDMEELTVEEIVQLLRQEGKEKNITSLKKASDKDLYELAGAIGGSPLLIRLVAGQLYDEPLSQILIYLRSARKKLEGTNELHPHYEIYKFIFRNSWQQMNKDADLQIVWICMGNFPANTGGKLNTITNLTVEHGIDSRKTLYVLKYLVSRSLVHKGGELGNERYFLHTNAKRFVLGDIVGVGQQWE